MDVIDGLCKGSIFVYFVHDAVALIVVKIFLHRLIGCVFHIFHQRISIIGHFQSLASLYLLRHLPDTVVCIVYQQSAAVIDLVEFVAVGDVDITVVSY
jgi:hypothetical protein